jgi:hypothetical protein
MWKILGQNQNKRKHLSGHNGTGFHVQAGIGVFILTTNAYSDFGDFSIASNT